MTDLLFIEIGAVVTKVLGQARCTIEPFCHPSYPPTYDPKNAFDVDFAQSLDTLLLDLTIDVADVAVQTQYDQIIAPTAGRVQIGPQWPGGGYEGILCIRADTVQSNSILTPAANALILPAQPQNSPAQPQNSPAPLYKYQVIASIAENRTVRRYHGFHAQVIDRQGEMVKFKIANHDVEITSNPGDYPEKFYVGSLVDKTINIITASLMKDQTGVVFVNLDAFTELNAYPPKLPPGAGL